MSDILAGGKSLSRFSEVVDAAVAQEPPPIHAKRQFRNDCFAFGLPQVAVPKRPTAPTSRPPAVCTTP